MFTFGAPLFLIGLVSAAIPLLIHLSRSRRPKKMQFSTTRFFTDQFLQSYRMSRLKELLLLALRMALCALLTLGLASPLWKPTGRTFLQGQSRAVALVLDNSASMGLEENGQTMLGRAQQAAKELVDRLRTGDSVALVLAGRKAAGCEAPMPEPTPELGDARQAIDNVQLSHLGTDLAGAVARARGALRGSQAKSKEIYVLSDLQSTGWQSSDSPTSEGDRDVQVFFVRIRPEQPADLAVTAIQYAASRPMARIPFSIRPHVRNQSARARDCLVRLFVDGQQVAERKIDQLQPGRWAVPRFHVSFDKGGWHEGYVEVQDDSLVADNRRFFTFDVVEQVRVLAVNGAPSTVARLDELFFLKTALTAPSQGTNSIQLDVVAPAGLSTAELADYRAVILANVESLDAHAVDVLETFVDQGGSLLTFLGDRVNATLYNQTLASSSRLNGGLLPARLLQVEGKPAKDAPAYSVAEFNAEHPALATFGDAHFAQLRGLGVKALWSVDPGDYPVLMRLDTGSPLLCEKSFGKGQVLLFTSSCDRDWTDFPVRPAWLPWVYRVVGYLAQEPLGRQGFFATGDAVPIPVSTTQAASQMLVKSPDKMLRQPVPESPGSGTLVYDDTSLPGVYSLFERSKEDVAERFVANLESYESDLTWLDDELAARGSAKDGGTDRQAHVESGLRDLLDASDGVFFVASPDQLAQASGTGRGGVKLWDLVLMLALGVALFEPWLANRASLRHYSRPKEVAMEPWVAAGRPGRAGRASTAPLEEVQGGT